MIQSLRICGKEPGITRWQSFLALLLFVWAAPAPASAQSVADIFDEYSLSTVLVWFQDSSTGFASYGTAFAIDDKGHLLTCYHVVAGREEVTVSIPGVGGERERNLPARVIATASGLDAAVLKVDFDGFTPVRLGNSDNLRAGEEVGFIGFPLGYTVESEVVPSLAMGYISSMRRWRIQPDGPRLRMIQVDALVAIGTSGSPLFRKDTGEVIGMMKSHVKTPGPVMSRQDVLSEIESIPVEMAQFAGIGLALPVNPLKNMIREALVDR